MLLLFLFLLLIDFTLGPRRTAAFSRVIDVPLGFSLRWINTFFTPSFVTLPLSPAVGGAEVGKIAAVFILGFVITMAITAYMVVYLQRLFGTSKRAITERAEEVPPPRSSASFDFSQQHRRSGSEPSQSLDLEESIEMEEFDHSVALPAVIEQPEPAAPRATRHTRDVPLPVELSDPEVWLNREIDNELSSMNSDLVSSGHVDSSNRQTSDLARTTTLNTLRRMISGQSQQAGESSSRILRENDTMTISSTGQGEIENRDAQDENVASTASIATVPAGVLSFFSIGEASPRAHYFANLITQYLDTFLYITVFLCVGLPLHFAISYSLIAYSTFTILMLFFGLRLPAKIRRFLHPIFTCSAFTILGIYVMSTAHRQTLDDGLAQYSTGRTYLNLFGVPQYYGIRPGAGDLMKTMLDVSIVSLALPMYRYRGDLKKHFLIIIIPNIIIGLVTFFAYPPLCYAIGISAERSIAFIGRSVTLALALPVIQSLGGSQSLVAVVAILSGIVGVLIGGYILKWLRIREDDYLTRGITLGINSSAVATAHLLTIDPRASALSSLSFVVFGTTLIILSAIPPIVTVMKGMVGL